MPRKHKYHHSPKPARRRSSDSTVRWSPKRIAEHQRLAEVLELTRDRLRNGEYAYDWYLAQACNVGLIARAALDMSAKELKAFVSQYATPGESESMISWTYMANHEQQRCEASGLPMSEVFQTFSDMGIGPYGIEIIESFGGKEYFPLVKTKYDFIDYLERLIASINQNLECQSELMLQALSETQKSEKSQKKEIVQVSSKRQ